MKSGSWRLSSIRTFAHTMRRLWTRAQARSGKSLEFSADSALTPAQAESRSMALPSLQPSCLNKTHGWMIIG